MYIFVFFHLLCFTMFNAAAIMPMSSNIFSSRACDIVSKAHKRGIGRWVCVHYLFMSPQFLVRQLRPIMCFHL